MDATSMIGRATGAIRKHARTLGFGSDARPQTPDLRTVPLWIAGAGYRPKEVARHKGMTPVPKGDEENADRILAATQPDDPVLAARMRADILASLHRDAPGDLRTRDIFAADPVIVADPETGWLVTESLFDARIGLFDSLNTLLGKPYLTASACDALRETLEMAFADLDPDSQREWCHSELRLEQGLAFLEGREPEELVALADTLRPVDESRGIWDTVRLFCVAARMADPDDIDPAPVAGLLG